MILELAAGPDRRGIHFAFAVLIATFLAVGIVTADLSAVTTTWACQGNIIECAPRSVASPDQQVAWWVSRLSVISAFVAACAWFKAALR